MSSRAMKFALYLSGFVFLLMTTVQCTSTRWTVQEFEAIDETVEPVRVDSSHTVMLADTVSHDNPFLTFDLYRVEALEYPQRVKLERTLQTYRPRWGFALLASLGASVAFYAGQTDRLVGTTTRQQSLAFYTAGTLLSVMAFTNMEPSGEPIRTGETRMMRESGTVVRMDTVRVSPEEAEDHPFLVEVQLDEESLLNRIYETGREGRISIRLTDLLADRSVTGPDPGTLHVEVSQNGTRESFSIPLNRFLRPTVTITSETAQLYSEPDRSQPPLTEVGGGSEFRLLNIDAEEWYQIRFGGSELYLSREAGEVRWDEEPRFATSSLVPVSDVPFGEISVEFSIPEIRTEQTGDAAWLIENLTNNQIGTRRYLDRDLRMMELYYRDALSVSLGSIYSESLVPGLDPTSDMARTNLGTEATLHAYIAGFAELRPGNEERDREAGIDLVHLNEEGDTTRVDLESMLMSLAGTDARNLVIWADLEFQHGLTLDPLPEGMSATDVYETIAERLQEIREQTAIVFSARPDQTSGLYESLRFEIKYHHLFPYYLAQGLQQGRTRLSDLVRYMENQVDFMSRRLHDRPQNIQSFGDLSIDLADQQD